jgi:hypothetical protein
MGTGDFSPRDKAAGRKAHRAHASAAVIKNELNYAYNFPSPPTPSMLSWQQTSKIITPITPTSHL